jgi:hypothetical protein
MHGLNASRLRSPRNSTQNSTPVKQPQKIFTGDWRTSLFLRKFLAIAEFADMLCNDCIIDFIRSIHPKPSSACD